MMQDSVGDELDPETRLVVLERCKPLLLRKATVLRESWHFKVVSVHLLLYFLPCDEKMAQVANYTE